MAFSVLNKNERVTDKDDMEVTPWQNDNENGLTISEVDKQDEKSLEDWLDDAENTDFDSSIITNTLSQLVSQNGIYTAINRVKNAVTGGDEKTSHRPGTTVSEEADDLGQRLKKLKAGKYKKNVKLSSKLGLYNSYMNLLGNAAGLYVGSLGKGAAEQIADAALGMTRVEDLTLGLSISSLKRILTTILDNGRENGVFSSVDIPTQDILSLNLANFFSINQSRPGLTIRGTNTNLLEFVSDPNYGITNELISGLISKLSSLGIPDKVLNNKATNSITNKLFGKDAQETASLISDKDKKKFSEQYLYISSDFINNYSINKNGVISPSSVVFNGEEYDKDISGKEQNLSEIESEISENETAKWSNSFNKKLNETNQNVIKNDIEKIKTNYNEHFDPNSREGLEALFPALSAIDSKNTELDRLEKEHSNLVTEEEKLNSEGKELLTKKNDAEAALTSAKQKFEDAKKQRADIDKKDTIFTSSFRKGNGVKIGDIDEFIADWIETAKVETSMSSATYMAGNIIGRDTAGKKVSDILKKEGDVYVRKTYERNDGYDMVNGGIYVEPYFTTQKKMNPIFIPFEFNADITENGLKASYTQNNILSKNISLRNYVGSDAEGVTINTQYMALSSGNPEYNTLTDYWMDGWDLNYIRKVESNLRALVFPTIQDNNFTRPPIVRIIPPTFNDGNFEKDYKDGIATKENRVDFALTNDLFKYPYGSDEDKIFEPEDHTKRPPQRTKRYVVSSVNITPMDAWNGTYGFNDSFSYRNGFKVQISLFETTRNFLDTIPTYVSYTGEPYNLKK